MAKACLKTVNIRPWATGLSLLQSSEHQAQATSLVGHLLRKLDAARSQAANAQGHSGPYQLDLAHKSA